MSYTLFVSVDYDEGNPFSYRGVVVRMLTDEMLTDERKSQEIYRCCTQNFQTDYDNAWAVAEENNLVGERIWNCSSVDDFFFDCEEAGLIKTTE